MLAPRSETDVHWVYLVGCPDGRLKVGRTMNPRDRIYQHRTNMGALRWHHFSARGTYGFANWLEERAIAVFEQIGLRIKRQELFEGIERDDAIRIVRSLAPGVRIELEESDRAHAARMAKQAAWERFQAEYLTTH